MAFPLFELALSGAVPLILASRAALSSCLPALSAFWIIHELLENIRAVQLHDPLHVLFQCFIILCEEVLHLVPSDLVPVPILHLKSELRDMLHDETVLRWHWVLLYQ
jgi:hypothetical protein